MIEWINNKFGLNLVEDEIKNVRDFSLTWNIFDNLVCQSEFSIRRIEVEYSIIDFTNEEIQPYFEYFRNRYVAENVINERFNYLRFRSNDREEFVRDVLLGNILDIKSKVLAITIIIYRFRNNLFHGLKDFRFINQQEKNFDNANNYLRIIINKF